jgi:WD40 repeat protein
VVAAGSGTLCAWELSSGNPVGDPIVIPKSRVSALAVGGSNGRVVAVTACDGRTLHVWDLTANRRHDRIEVGALIHALRGDEAGGVIVGAHAGVLRLVFDGGLAPRDNISNDLAEDF